MADLSTPSEAGRSAGGFAAVTAFARREPGKVLATVLGIHLVTWTLLPILLSHNLQLDLVEDLALGKEWQLGYWKNPSLPWWAADLAFRLTGQVDSVYLLGPLAAVLCFYAVWLLGRDILGPFQALVAVLILQGIHFYNYSIVKFAHDQMQLPFWAFTGLFFYRALVHARTTDWVLAGIFLGGAFWSKYAAIPLAVTLGLFLLFDPFARRAWRTAGPIAMAVAFAIVIAPNVWWLIANDFLPLHYVNARAKAATHWYLYLAYPLAWTGNQLFFLLPAVGLLALLYVRRHGMPLAGTEQAAFQRRYLAALALGPFAVTTAVAAVLGRLPVSMWGYPMWSFAPLAVLAWLGPVQDAPRLVAFAKAVAALLLGWPLIYAAIELFEPLLRDRARADQFPGTEVATRITRAWRDAFGEPLSYVCGSEFFSNNIAVYSPDRPRVLVQCDPKRAPWIEMGDLRHKGIVVACDATLVSQSDLDRWRAAVGEFAMQPTLMLARQTAFPESWHAVPPVRVFYGFVPPRP